MIKFSNVSLIYPHSTKTIIEDLTFSIQEGEMVLVMGETGSGKSSLLRLINGLVPHHTGGILAGDISVDGISTREVKPGSLAHIVGIVGQNPLNGFVADIVEEELAFGMEALNFPHDVMRKRVEEVLDLLGLNAVRHRSIATLSGGEQQRVALARAFVTQPAILFADEPTGNLDKKTGQTIIDLIFRLNRDQHTTLVLVTHDPALAERCDRTLQLDGGRLISGGPA